MYLPTPNEYAAQHGHTPFPPRWERWLSALRRGILTGRGIAGQNMSVDVHPGEGTVYNATDDSRGRNPVSGGGGPPIPTGACCHDDGTCNVLTEVNCNSTSGNYQGDGTPCTEGLCLGACCYPNGSCADNMTKADCENGGGTFQDFQSDCGPPNPCPCPSVSVVCDSISASKSKCGFTDFTSLCAGVAGTYYLTETCSYINNCACCDGPCIVYSGSTVWTYDPNTCTRTGVGGVTRHSGGSCVPGFFQVGPAQSGGCSGICVCFPDQTSGVLFSITDTYVEVRPTDYGHSLTGNCNGAPGSYVRATTATLSDEYTTAMLISNTEAALPSYDDDYNDPCSASRDLSDDESSYTIQRFKPKFTISEALSMDLTICYNEHYVPDEGDPVDTARTVTIPAGDTEVIGDEVTEPDENGEITITDITCCPA